MTMAQRIWSSSSQARLGQQCPRWLLTKGLALVPETQSCPFERTTDNTESPMGCQEPGLLLGRNVLDLFESPPGSRFLNDTEYSVYFGRLRNLYFVVYPELERTDCASRHRLYHRVILLMKRVLLFGFGEDPATQNTSTLPTKFLTDAVPPWLRTCLSQGLNSQARSALCALLGRRDLGELEDRELWLLQGFD